MADDWGPDRQACCAGSLDAGAAYANHAGADESACILHTGARCMNIAGSLGDPARQSASTDLSDDFEIA
ncbi:hypothetical protein PGT21_009841 [Puccinia graminis f. sp. tritici]|uniref:Uncharacterized protein n=1 Tax=Puccinia graminis f. sp. tritici TaxID=56615 RepID=A0A5B0N5B9_PUCGR|nr:hypothetical protein PGT21_009841 [Puccinia graminis f. sp. tritici]